MAEVKGVPSMEIREYNRVIFRARGMHPVHVPYPVLPGARAPTGFKLARALPLIVQTMTKIKLAPMGLS